METELSAFTPANWRVRSVEEVCTRVTSGGTPSRREPAYYIGGSWPWVKTQELKDGWLHDTEEHITDEAVARSSAKVLPKNSVLVAMYGATVGQLGILRRPMSCNQACSALVVDPAEADYRYLFFQLLHARSRLKSLATGAAQQNLSGVLIKSLRFPFPPLSEQRAIAHILGTLDDKIELNRRMNEILEAIARALFKSWFVDFDPVRAKSEGRDSSLPSHLADLFADSFEDSELGEIPKGWRVSSVGLELATLLGGTPSRTESTYWEGGAIPWINSGKANEFRITEPSEFITAEGMARSATKLLPERTTIVAITGATLGQVSLLEIEACANQSVVGVLGSRTLPGEFVYFWIRERIEDLVSRQTGGAQQHVNKNDVDGLAILMPSRQVVSAFQGIAGPIFDRIKISCLETRTLAALRDALLPKLISGELRVKHPEWLLEAAT